MKQINELIGVGSIAKQGSQSIQLIVGSIKDMKIIIDYFNKYPFITNK